MTPEKLESIKKIAARIELLDKEKIRWEESVRVHEIMLATKGYRHYSLIEFIDFDLLKAITLAKLNKELDELKREFDSL